MYQTPKVNKKAKSRIFEKYETQSDFAIDIGVDESLVSKIIRGRRKISLANKKKWAKALRCKVSDIFEDYQPDREPVSPTLLTQEAKDKEYESENHPV